MKSDPGAPARRSQAERSATAARRMLRAAGKLIAKQGFSKTTLAQVGKEAGYTGGLVSHHFGSKEGLLRQLVGRITGRFYDDQLAPVIEGKTGIEALCAQAEAYLDELVLREERMRTLYVLMGESLGPVSEVGEVFAQLDKGFRVNLRRMIEEGIAAGQIRADADPDVESALCLALLRGVGMQWMTDPGCIDLEGVKTSVQEAMRRQLAAEPGEQAP